MDAQTQKEVLSAQKNELTEHYIYSRLARSVRDPRNKEVLQRIAEDELRHSRFWSEHTQQEVKPSRAKIWWYHLISRVLGLTFGIKLMETGEDQAGTSYRRISRVIPEAAQVATEEQEHERELIDMLDEERLRYTGAIVRGLNDALVELTGALAGFTFALAKPGVIAMVGLITGISASLSMAGSEYLARKNEPSDLSPGKASLYTGLAYILTVVLLIIPYLVFDNVYLSLAVMVATALLIICVFNFYIAVAKSLPFGTRLAEMAGISVGIAVLSFGLGALIRHLFRVEV